MTAQQRQEIAVLIERREKARAEKKWSEADSIRDELVVRGVQVMDRDDLWRCGQLVGLYNPTYNIKDGAIRICMEVREEARVAKNYENSDAIRDMLKQAGIEIKDKEGIWWSTRDGRRGNISEILRGPGGCQPSLPPVHLPPTSRLGGASVVGGSSSSFRSRSPSRGISPPGFGYMGRPTSSGGHGNGMVHHGGARVGMACGAASMAAYRTPMGSPPPPPIGHPPMAMAMYGSDGVLVPLHDFLAKREEMRNNRDWEAADKIRDVLQMVGVHLKDKERRWSTADGRSGEFPVIPR